MRQNNAITENLVSVGTWPFALVQPREIRFPCKYIGPSCSRSRNTASGCTSARYGFEGHHLVLCKSVIYIISILYILFSFLDCDLFAGYSLHKHLNTLSQVGICKQFCPPSIPSGLGHILEQNSENIFLLIGPQLKLCK